MPNKDNKFKCKNCKKEIQQVCGKWYHSESQKYFCSRKHAEQELELKPK